MSTLENDSQASENLAKYPVDYNPDSHPDWDDCERYENECPLAQKERDVRKQIIEKVGMSNPLLGVYGLESFRMEPREIQISNQSDDIMAGKRQMGYSTNKYTGDVKITLPPEFYFLDLNLETCIKNEESGEFVILKLTVKKNRREGN
jgi:hypothetical protein